MRFTVSEAELYPENQKNNKIIHDGAGDPMHSFVTIIKGFKDPRRGKMVS